jgi:hypothetical protein
MIDHALMWTRLSADGGEIWVLPLLPTRDDCLIHSSRTGAEAPQYFSFTGAEQF